jgi:hypothetical protein
LYHLEERSKKSSRNRYLANCDKLGQTRFLEPVVKPFVKYSRKKQGEYSKEVFRKLVIRADGFWSV